MVMVMMMVAVVMMWMRMISSLAQTPLLSFRLMQHYLRLSDTEPNCLGSILTPPTTY